MPSLKIKNTLNNMLLDIGPWMFFNSLEWINYWLKIFRTTRNIAFVFSVWDRNWIQF